MKKIPLILILISCITLLTGCADVNGLHNQMAVDVTFIFKNFPENVSGNYTIPGNFNNWDNTKTTITMKNGSGTSVPITIAEKNIQFSLVKTGDWLRGWYPEVKGNGSDSGVMRNFYIDDLDLTSGEITLMIDGSKSTATPVVE